MANVVQYVNEKVCEISEATHNINSLNIAILVALNIADEYLKMKRANKDIVNQLEGRSEQLIRLIDTAC